MSVPLFVSRYLVVMPVEKEAVHPHMMQHLKDIMADTELYSMAPATDTRAGYLSQGRGEAQVLMSPGVAPCGGTFSISSNPFSSTPEETTERYPHLQCASQARLKNLCRIK